MKRTYAPPTVPLEDAEQRIIFQWAAMETAARPELGLLYAIPNGGKRAIKTAIALKAQGVKSGVPDMCLPVARGAYHGLYIELKRQKGGTVSEICDIDEATGGRIMEQAGEYCLNVGHDKAKNWRANHANT